MPAPLNEVDMDSLDVRIAQAEQRLMDRQLGIQQRWTALNQGARAAVRPQRLLTPLLGAGVAAFVAWWVRRGLAPAQKQVGTAPSPSRRVGGLSWSELLLIAWPLLPTRWRARISPATATSLLAMGLPLFERLAGRDTSAPPPDTVVGVDMTRFVGTWFEIARLPVPFGPKPSSQPTTTYIASSTDSGEIDVVHRGPGRKGGERVTHGVAHVVPGSGGGKFKVSLMPVWLRWLPFAWMDQWLLFLDRDYTVALVGDPKRDFLWVLARQPDLPEGDLHALVALAQQAGYPVERLHRVSASYKQARA